MMAEESGGSRALAWVVVLVCAALSFTLVVVVVTADLSTTMAVAAIAGALGSLAGAFIAGLSLLRETSTSGGRGRLQAKRNSAAASGDITGSAIGSGSQVMGPTSNPPGNRSRSRSAVPETVAEDSAAATAGNITDSAVGTDSLRSTHDVPSPPTSESAPGSAEDSQR